MADKSVCTSKKAAELLNVTPRTIQLWAESGILNSWKTPGGHRRYFTKDVMALAEQVKNEATTHHPQASEKVVKLLIIEDDLDLLKLYQLTIERWGLPVDLEIASDGYSGLIKLGEFKPDLLVLDLNLPNIDGFRIIESLVDSELLRSMKLLVVSGLPISDIKEKIHRVEEGSILRKPVPFERIKQELVSLIEC